jgi:hypothetical protein
MWQEQLLADFSDKFAFYCFWRDQYMFRKEGRRDEYYDYYLGSQELIKRIIDKTVTHHALSRSYDEITDFNKTCPLLDCGADFITMRIPRDIDEKLLWAIFKMYKCCPCPTDKELIAQGGTPADGFGMLEAVEDVGRRVVEMNPRATFKSSQWESRAIGLWLWDYVQDNGGERNRGVIAAAIRTMKKQLEPEIKALGFADSEDRVFRGFYSKTAASIEAGEVLSFK